jgi:hypothetical protein
MVFIVSFTKGKANPTLTIYLKRVQILCTDFSLFGGEA